ncbi:MAG: hypothetical protein ACLFS7_03080 [Desulfosudaceae bacterium]
MTKALFPHFFKILAVVLLVLTPLATIASGSSDGDRPDRLSLTTIGTGHDDSDDNAASKNAAIENALQAAVEKAAQELIPEAVLTSSFQLIDPLFYGQAEKYVLNYTVRDIYHRDDYCRALVKCEIAGNDMIRHISEAGIILNRTVPPRILLLIQEKISDQEKKSTGDLPAASRQINTSRGPAAKAMAGNFRNRGFLVLDHPSTGFSQEKPAPTTEDESGHDQAFELARQAGADFVITGRIEAIPDKTASSWSGQAEIRALNLSSGRSEEQLRISSSSGEKNGEDLSGAKPALAATGELVADKLAPDLASAFQRLSGRTRSISLIVQGEKYLAGLKFLRKKMEALPGISDFQLQEMSVNQAVFNASVAVSSDKLAESLAASSGEGGHIRVIDVTEDRIIIAINPVD